MANEEATTIKVLVLCSNSEGAPEMHTCSVEATPEQIAEGLHYDWAKENADFNGYEEPMIAFDERDPAARMILDDSLREWLTAVAPSVEVTPVTVTGANDATHAVETRVNTAPWLLYSVPTHNSSPCMNLKGTQSVLPALQLAMVFIGSVFLGLLVCIIGGRLFNASRLVVGTAWLLVSSTLFLVLVTATLTYSVRMLLQPEEVKVLKEWAAEFPEVDAALQALRSKTMEPRFWHFLAIQRIAKRAFNKREYERARTTLQDALK